MYVRGGEDKGFRTAVRKGVPVDQGPHAGMPPQQRAAPLVVGCRGPTPASPCPALPPCRVQVEASRLVHAGGPTEDTGWGVYMYVWLHGAVPHCRPELTARVMLVLLALGPSKFITCQAGGGRQQARAVGVEGRRTWRCSAVQPCMGAWALRTTLTACPHSGTLRMLHV